MSAPWQELAAYAAVALAALWLGLRWRRRKRAKACDGCHATTGPAQRGRVHLPVVDPK
jgi:hypothetical protein